MGEVPAGWDDLVATLEPLVPPEWTKNARDHGGQPWIRLIVMVDAHNTLSQPRIAEKIAMTMADLAQNREAEAAGWTAIMEKARDERMEIAAKLVDAAPALLSEELYPLFARSVDPYVQM